MKMTKHISNTYFVLDGIKYRRQLNDKTLIWWYDISNQWYYVPELQSKDGIHSHIKLESMYINYKREKKLNRILED
jgi:hypothetical protein